MNGLKTGHHTNETDGTGVSVFLFDQPAAGAYVICGSAPASHELSVLDPENSVNNIHALMSTGGSAYGLFAAQGVMQFLTERKQGIKVPHGVVPIVPAAAIYDLAYKHAVAPAAKDAYQACLNAYAGNIQSGRLGAGYGATVGKLVKNAHPMTGGLGYASQRLEDGLEVCAYAVVNAAGDIYNERGDIIAGARKNNEFIDCSRKLSMGERQEEFICEVTNSTLVAIFTNGAFTKAELKAVAKTAAAGIARVISPVFTCYDGDIVFAVSLGNKTASVLTAGAIAANLVKLAVMDAVKNTEVIYEHSYHFAP